MRKFSRATRVLSGGVLCLGVLYAGVLAFGPAGPTGTASAAPGAAAGGATESAGAATQPTTPFASAWYQLFAPYLSGAKLCLDVPGGSTATGGQLQLDDCHAPASGSGTQRWEFVPIGTTGHYHIQNDGDALCIGLQANAPFAGNAITQNLCSVAPWWDVVPVNGYSPVVYIKETYYNLVLTANSAKDDKNRLIAEPIRTTGPSAPDPTQVFQLSAR